MALFKTNVSYKMGTNQVTKQYIVNAVSLKAALVKVFQSNPDLETTSEASILCETVTIEILG